MVFRRFASSDRLEEALLGSVKSGMRVYYLCCRLSWYVQPVDYEPGMSGRSMTGLYIVYSSMNQFLVSSRRRSMDAARVDIECSQTCITRRSSLRNCVSLRTAGDFAVFWRAPKNNQPGDRPKIPRERKGAVTGGKRTGQMVKACFWALGQIKYMVYRPRLTCDGQGHSRMQIESGQYGKTRHYGVRRSWDDDGPGVTDDGKSLRPLGQINPPLLLFCIHILHFFRRTLARRRGCRTVIHNGRSQ